MKEITIHVVENGFIVFVELQDRSTTRHVFNCASEMADFVAELGKGAERDREEKSNA